VIPKIWPGRGATAGTAGALVAMTVALTSAVPSPAPASASVVATITPPHGYKYFVSKVLPYTIYYPPTWTVTGPLWGTDKPPSGTFRNGDTWNKKEGNIYVEAEKLPPGSLLTSASYEQAVLLQLYEDYEESSAQAYTARFIGTIRVDGVSALVLDYALPKQGIEDTDVIWVEKNRGWQALLAFPTLSDAVGANLPPFVAMVKTFQVT
jgi:hypothetical protein